MNQSQDLDARIRLTAPANPSRSHIPSFTTGDEIGGTIFVTAPRDVAFEELQVLLIGILVISLVIHSIDLSQESSLPLSEVRFLIRPTTNSYEMSRPSMSP
jgi:hypothetical protein